MDGFSSPRFEHFDLDPLPAAVAPAPAPGLFTRLMMAVAGIDLALARRCPPNEWPSLAMAGAGLLVGAGLTGFGVWVALGELFGADLTVEGRTLVTALATGVRFIVDRKFVTADWYAQGLAYGWSHGLIRPPGRLRRAGRTLGVGGRLAYSLAFSSLIALVLMTLVFGGGIQRRLAQENLVDNAPLAAAATLQYERRLRETGDGLAQSERAAQALEAERTALLAPLPADSARTAEIDRVGARLDGLREARAGLERKAAEHESNRNAEKSGVQAYKGASGLEGPGKKFEFHRDEAERLRNEVKARSAEIAAADAELAELRRLAADERARQEAMRAQRLPAIETRLSELATGRAELAAERTRLLNDREGWIERKVRAAPGYKPLPTDIGDRLRVLRLLAEGSAFLAGMMLVLELTVVAFESAGPISKFAFTPPTHYAMWVALRLETATDLERDRRAELTWRLAARERRRESTEPDLDEESTGQNSVATRVR